MNRLFLIFSFLFILTYASGQEYKAPVNQRMTYNINSDWKLKIGDIPNAKNFNFDDSSWQPVTLPHAFNEDEAFRVNIKELTDNVVLYRKHFHLPNSD